MCITFTPPSPVKARVMDTSYYVFDDDISIVIPYPQMQADGVKALLDPFQTEVSIEWDWSLLIKIHLFSGLDLLDLFVYFGFGRRLAHWRSGARRREVLLRATSHELHLFVPRNGP